MAKYLRRWLKEVKRGALRARTFADYSGVLRRYIEDPPDGAPPIGKIRVDRVTPAAIQSLYSFLHQEEDLSPRTIRSLHAVVRQGLAHAARTGAVPRNAAGRDLVVLPKMEKREVAAMTPEEADRFLKAAKEDRYFALGASSYPGASAPVRPWP